MCKIIVVPGVARPFTNLLRGKGSGDRRGGSSEGFESIFVKVVELSLSLQKAYTRGID